MDESALQTRDPVLRDYVDILLRRRRLVGWTLLIILALTALYTLLAPRTYRSTTRLLADTAADTVTRRSSNDPFSDLYVGSPAREVETQLELLQSPDLLAEVCSVVGIPRQAVRLSAKRVFNTEVIEVAVDSRQPSYARRLAEAIPAAYLRSSARTGRMQVADALDWTQRRLKEQTVKLNAAEADLQRFKERLSISNLDKQRDTRILEAAALSAAIENGEAAAKGYEGQIATLIALRRRQSRYLETPVATTNKELESLRSRIAELENDRAKLIVLYKPSHTKVQEVDAEIANLRARLASIPRMVTVITRTPNPTASAYDGRIADLRVSLASKRNEVAQARADLKAANEALRAYNGLERRQAQLQREVDRYRDTVALLTKTVEDLSIRQKAMRSPAVTIAVASRARQVWPRPGRLMLAAFMLGGMLAVGLALLADHLDPRIRTREEALRILDSPVVGCIPYIHGDQARLSDGQPSPAEMESFRMMRTNVLPSTADRSSRALLVTSTAPNEGKTTTATNLAKAMALGGRRVILVDADLRFPSVHSRFGLPQVPGLGDVLLDGQRVEDVLQSTNIPGLQVLCAGTLPANPAEVIESPEMTETHRRLKEMADVVILDSPPLLEAADTQILARITDGLLYVVQMRETARVAMERAAELIALARANVVGIVLNKVDDISGSYSYYGSSRSRYYRGRQGGDQSAERPALPMGEGGNPS